MTSENIDRQLYRQIIYGAVFGNIVVVVDNFAFEGEVSPIVIVAMLVVGTAVVGGLWGWRGWCASVIAWICVPTAHIIKHVLGLPDTLHPNTYASILLLAAFTFVISLLGTGIGVLLRRVTTTSENRSS
jgi:hypothetical protein